MCQVVRDPVQSLENSQSPPGPFQGRTDMESAVQGLNPGSAALDQLPKLPMFQLLCLSVGAIILFAKGYFKEQVKGSHAPPPRPP